MQTLQSKAPVLWANPLLRPAVEALNNLPFGQKEMHEAAKRLQGFSGLLEDLFPELKPSQGIIESPLLLAPQLQQQLMGLHPASGTLYIKADHSLPVAGSIKARGGLYEVLTVAEQLAREAGFLKPNDNLRLLNSAQAKKLFASHSISVGSTGNLGLSIGIIAAVLGFNTIVHMSAEAKDWKKQRLLKRGVTVIEHRGDYASAVAAGRQQASDDPTTHFVDDENSLQLFFGYSVAALQLKDQLYQSSIRVDAEHPLFIYIPCGVGGAPGGITFGLKQIFGDHVHCFFAEPVSSPCLLTQLAFGQFTVKGQQQAISVYDIGLDNQTEADGLAVASASMTVAASMQHLVSGIFTVADDDLYRWLYLLFQTESLKVEPSAVAGFAGPDYLLATKEGQNYCQQNNLTKHIAQSTHILWTTGGAFVPAEEYQDFYQKGAALHSNTHRVNQHAN